MTMTHDQNDEATQRLWQAAVACCTTLHDIGFDAEEIAEEMPLAMHKLNMRGTVFTGDAIKNGQDYAESLAATRAGREA